MESTGRQTKAYHKLINQQILYIRVQTYLYSNYELVKERDENVLRSNEFLCIHNHQFCFLGMEGGGGEVM